MDESPKLQRKKTNSSKAQREDFIEIISTDLAHERPPAKSANLYERSAIAWIFEAELSPNEWPFIELALGYNIVAHVSMRASEKCFVFNTKKNGKWDVESRFDATDNLSDIVRGRIVFSKDGWKVEIARHKFTLPPGVTTDHNNLKVNASPSVRWKKLGTRTEKKAARSKFLTCKGIGCDLILAPLGVSRAAIEGHILDFDFSGRDRLSGFVSTRVFNTRQIDVYVANEADYLAGIALALQWPNTHFLFVIETAEQKLFLEHAFKNNGIRNSIVTSSSTPPSGETGREIMTIGRDLFSRDELRGLVKAAKHIICVETDVPAYGSVIAGRKNGNIHLAIAGNPRLALNWHSKGHQTAMTPGLDVCVAMYNARDHIVECVESLLVEGRDDISVLVVDDGSTDDSVTILREHFENNRQVLVVSKDNGGCASARNYGRFISNKTHITFVDADDFVDKGFFSDLLELAFYTGAEVVQGDFDFYDDKKSPRFYPSYEEDLFKDLPSFNFGTASVKHVGSHELLHGQPTIWRRVYRRDFLDSKNIYFPENVRAYDDYLFHLLTMAYAPDLYIFPGKRYHYRQHPLQDIKQGDERHFYELYMFRMLLKRSIEEGWENFERYAHSFINCMNWSITTLREDLVERFVRSAAEVCAAIRKIYGIHAMPDWLVKEARHADFAYEFDLSLKAYSNLGDSYAWGLLHSVDQHPDFLRMSK